MYSLVVLLSILASASFVLAFVRVRAPARRLARRVADAAALHAHVGRVPRGGDEPARGCICAGAARSTARDGVRLAAVLALVYLPWLPVILFQAAHTAAPWAERPSPLSLLIIPGGLFGHVATAAAGDRRALRRAPPPLEPASRVLLGIASATAVLAWLCSQIEPAWATRYLAVVLGPAAARAGVRGRRAGERWTVVALVGVAVVWAMSGPPPTKSNVRTVSASFAPSIRPGDLVVSTQPEQVPALYRYLPAGVVYLTPMGLVSDPRQTDWRDGLVAAARRARRDRAAAARRPARPRPARLDRHAGAGHAALRSRRGRARCGSARASGGRRWRPRRG